MQNFIICFLMLGLTSCATHSGHSSTYKTYPPSPLNGYRGLIATEFIAPSTSDMAALCQSLGGLDYSSIREEETPSWKQAGMNYRSYKCNGLVVAPRSNPQTVVAPVSINTPVNNALSMQAAKDKCADLGFKLGTEGFGSCVLKLSK